MSDSLILTGVKDIKQHTGTEMLRLNPKRGGDTFQIKRWWTPGANGTVYVRSTVFDVTTDAGTVKLVLETSAESKLRIIHTGSFNFTFSNVNGVSRAALFTDEFVLIEHYVFPSISGGKIMTVTPPGSASRPVPEAPVSFTATSSVSGTAEVDEGLTFTAGTFTGGKGTVSTNLIIQTSANGTSGWSFLEGHPGTASGGAVTLTVPAAQSGQYLRASYQVSDDDGLTTSNSAASDQIAA
tara:strand:- start:1178 stop:1894 length:717 start_codon:yes stop_codon:yes gene_type:complete